MKHSLLNYISCPACGAANFSLEKEIADEIEIRAGVLNCLSCQNVFKIKNGLLYLHLELGPEAEKEIIAVKKEISQQLETAGANFQDKEWLLNFPDNKKLGADERMERVVRLSSENTLLYLDKFFQAGNLKILEIGAGNCWLTARLAKHNECIALDIFTDFPPGLEAADVFIKEKKLFFERVVADMSDLPFSEKVFDAVVFNSALHHSSDPVKCLKDISRVLKDNGRLILFNEPSEGLISRESDIVKQELEAGYNEGRYTLKQWKEFFKNTGFKAKIFLPANFINILKARGGLVAAVGSLLVHLPKPIKNGVIVFLGLFIFKIFDGFFTALLTKDDKFKSEKNDTPQF